MDRFDLMLMLPEFYRSAPFVELQRVLGEMAHRASEDVDFVMAQLWLQTASGWGLELWENAYGIPTEAGKNPDYRRTRIIAKPRGQGTPTAALIQSVASSFANGEAEVIEDSEHYMFTVKFTSMMGIPPNIDDLTSTIREIKPAH